ncbi:SRPBCC family protein [Sphingopyxis yananensis]|uniref:SRPBCC family protein n=1 Tax=Sphingopyxis yananensis TaxID=2886687 RepID=UPI001D125B8B|nr:SRPBCC family protein [Sphingopyxis yananensis]MCC2603091.1 SRPBCC family protein [Sphingopyxis yananensis]
MADFEIATRFNAPADVVWSYVNWAGMPRLTEGGFFTSADFPEGPEIRPGALRRVTTPDGSAFIEQLVEEVSNRIHVCRYTLVDTGPFPLTDYSGIVVVTPAGDGCCLKFGHRATLVDVSEEEWRSSWLSIENQVFDFIRQKVECS